MGGTGQDVPPPGRELVDRIGALFAGLRPRSRASLQHALHIHETPGVGAVLVIQIPTDPDKPCELYFSTAPSSLVSDLSKH